MIKSFVLILSVVNMSSFDSEFVIEDGLSLQDCLFLASEWEPTLDEYSRVWCYEEL